MSSESRFNFAGRPAAVLAIIAGLAIGFGWFFVEWTWNRIYVPEGYSLRLRYQGPPLPVLPGGRPPAEGGQFAKVSESGKPLELGVLAEMVGPGRHFYCPLWWERDLVPDIDIEPGEVGIVTSRMGANLPAGEFLVDGDLGTSTFKGTLRKVLGPGRYRINDYAYTVKVVQVETIKSGTQVKHAGWVTIPAGYVGVVTNLAENRELGTKAGIQSDVLQPGIYPINPREQQVDIIEIGYRENSIAANLQMAGPEEPRLDESGEPMIANDDSGIKFPSNDGFEITMDFTAVWGIMPEQAPTVVRKYGNIHAVEQRVVLPQIQSICRNEGSKLGAVELLVGESRLIFQDNTSLAFKTVLEEQDVTLLYGLVRHIYIPQQVRLPIQESFIADELKLTRDQEILTTKTEADLKEAEQTVLLEAERIRVETEKKVAQALAEGQKTAEETKAKTQQLVAAIDRQTAELDAEASVVRGEATAGAKKLLEQARAGKFQLAVEAFGSGDAYNQWVFATGLPDDIRLNLLYAGDGTFWTDLKGFSEAMLGRMQQERAPAATSPAAQPAPRPAPVRTSR